MCDQRSWSKAVSSHSDSDGMGSIPVSPNALNVPFLLCQERFNEASLPDQQEQPGFAGPISSHHHISLVLTQAALLGCSCFHMEVGQLLQASRHPKCKFLRGHISTAQHRVHCCLVSGGRSGALATQTRIAGALRWRGFCPPRRAETSARSPAAAVAVLGFSFAGCLLFRRRDRLGGRVLGFADDCNHRIFPGIPA